MSRGEAWVNGMDGSRRLMGGIMEWNMVRVRAGSQEGSWRSSLAMSQMTSDMTQNSEGAAEAPKGRRNSRKAKAPNKMIMMGVDGCFVRR